MNGVTNSVDVNINKRLFGKVANFKYLEIVGPVAKSV